MHVDHVESSGVGDSPELGETLHVHGYVSLGDLTPDDVEVQVVHGRTNHHGDELHDVSSVPLAHVESYEHGRHQFAGDLVLRSSGAFGYTVRVAAEARRAGPAQRARPGRQRLTRDSLPRTHLRDRLKRLRRWVFATRVRRVLGSVGGGAPRRAGRG